MWAVHNSIKSWTLYNLSLREVQLLLNTMSANEIKLTKAIHQGGSEWLFITKEQFPDFFTNTGKVNTGFVDFKVTEALTESNTDFFIIQPKRPHLARLHERIEIQVKVIIEGQRKSFESTTVDISEGGICFKEAIPEWVSGYFIVRIFTLTSSHQVICSLVEDQKIKQRVQIVSEDNDTHFLKYKEWLSSLV